jgi:hypothetical protein
MSVRELYLEEESHITHPLELLYWMSKHLSKENFDKIEADTISRYPEGIDDSNCKDAMSYLNTRLFENF